MSSTPTSHTPRIAIIGGGIGGLVVLLTLVRKGIPATIYERDADLNMRAHMGSMLDLGWDSGQRALRENGLEEQFKANSRVEGEEVRVGGKDGVPLIHHNPEDTKDETQARPEIDRSDLRKIMLDAVPAESIKWGHTLASVRPLADGTHELAFANGLSVIADIVIGADGANSRVRPLVSSATPTYHEITGAEVSIAPDLAASPLMSDVSEAVGRGSCFLCEKRRVMAIQRNGDGRIRAYAWHHNPDPYFPTNPTEAKKALLEIYSDWAPWVRKFLEHCEEDAVYSRPLTYLPVGHRWAHKDGVTVIGDAAHLMSPAAGAGANLAMLDGLELGIALGDALSKGVSAGEREAAITAVEEKMFARAEKSARISYSNLEAMFSPDAPHSAIGKFRAFMESDGRREA